MTKLPLHLVLAPAFAAPRVILAQAQAQAQAEPVRDALASPIGVSTLLGLAASLVVVIAAILFAGWAYARLRGAGTGASRVISVLAAQSVGPKERIVLVQIGDKQLAVGMTPGSVNTLHVFDDHIIGLPEKRTTTPFAAKLRSALARVGSR